MLVLELPPIVVNQKGVFLVGVLRHVLLDGNCQADHLSRIYSRHTVSPETRDVFDLQCLSWVASNFASKQL